MDIAACYRLLELNSSASLAEVKASYRRLARQYHPDVHPGDRQAQDKFIQLTEAYQILLRVAKPSAAENVPSQSKPASVDDQHQTQQVRVSVQHPTVDEEMPPEQSYAPDKTPIRITRKAPGFQTSQPLSPLDQQLKDNSYQQLQELLKYQRFPRAIALVEGLAQRLPQDPEVRQWRQLPISGGADI